MLCGTSDDTREGAQNAHQNYKMLSLKNLFLMFYRKEKVERMTTTTFSIKKEQFS